MNDTIINKIQSIQRCVARAREEYWKNPSDFDKNFSMQDAAVMNVIRACEQAIDLANHIIKREKMGIPSSSYESFELLEEQRVIDGELSRKLKNMTRFRNLVIHQYEKMDIEIVKSVILNDLSDVVRFSEIILELNIKKKKVLSFKDYYRILIEEMFPEIRDHIKRDEWVIYHEQAGRFHVRAYGEP